MPSQSLKPEAVPAVKRYETLLEVALGADVAEHVQLLLVFSAHAFFLSVRTVETREFSGSTCVFPQPAKVQTLEASEKEFILRALREANGVIASAAGKLGMKRTTLNSKMRKLHISRSDLFSA